jgi:hypothetical protein
VEKGKTRLLIGPETIVFGNDGTLFIMTEQSNLCSLTDFEKDEGGRITAKSTLVADLGVGRPLGGRFTFDNTLYIADVVLGLTRIKNPGNPKSKVELVASQVKDKGEWTRILFTDDVTIGPKSGMVYFTDGAYNFFYC